MLPNLRTSDDNIAHHYPKKVLALLSTILPEDVSLWPYGIQNILKTIGEAGSSLRQDGRFVELMRRWNAR